MNKKINEAAVKLDIEGLESDDLETLSRVLSLAGQAQKSNNPVRSELPKMSPFDFDSIENQETPAIIGDDELEHSVVDDLADQVSALDSSVTDFGDDDTDVSMELDVDGTPGIADDEFDIDSMSSLAGISDVRESEESEDDEVLDESQLLPDLSLDEDADAHDPDNTEYGPFSTESSAVQHALEQTNGVEGDNFIVVPKNNQYFWKRTIKEEQQTTQPDPEFYDNEGIENSRHEYRPKRPGTPLGDNPLAMEGIDDDEEMGKEAETAAEDDEDSVEQILENLTKRYNKFLRK